MLTASYEVLEVHTDLGVIRYGTLGNRRRTTVARLVRQLAVLGSYLVCMGDVAREIVRTGRDVSVSVLGVERPDGHGDLTDLVVGDEFVGIGSCVRTVVDGTSETESRYTGVVQTGHVGRTGEVISLKETLLTASHPFVTVETVGIQSCHDHRLVVESGIAFSKFSQELNTRLMPGAGDDGGLSLRT